ncbi:hypothetical protein ACIGZJ_30920 [Kitasatospora sp. NPDC052868]|uniref:hypothetical protein n=1 Tax=Kitasatospora sp. NPDC052868 TaxID=3364060 RepID=UPI0037C5D287
MTQPYPHRLRLHGGRNTHAAKPVRLPSGETALLTACGYRNGPKDELKPDDASVTCRATACQIASKETSR